VRVHKILIVDDDKATCDLLRACLSEAYEVIDTVDPEQALGLALEHKPDAILLDLMMPKFSGFELCQSFLSLSYTSTIPILVITGETEAKYKDHCANLGAVAYFEKPLKLDELRRRLTMELQSKRSEQRTHVRVRMRLALRLRGTFLQTIQGSKLVADDALDPSTDPVRMRRAMEQLSVWLRRATEEGRAALNSLRTSTTEKNDLAAFQRAMEECRIHTSMEASLSVVGEVREMHPIVRDEVYRIGYEAIRNACVHSQASQLRVELTYDHDLALRVSDNGVGVDPAVADRGREGHFGLQGMRERAARIVGKLTLVSSAASGTEIKLVVPGSIIYRETTSNRRKLSAKIKAVLKRLGLTSNPD
jgi:signal transduction histidine kinase